MTPIDELVSETIRADHHTGLKTDTFPQRALSCNNDTGHQPAIVAHDSSPAQKDLGLKIHPLADPHPIFNHTSRADRGAFRDHYVLANRRRPVHACFRSWP